MQLNQVFRLIFDVFLYKDQVCGLKVRRAGMSAGTWCKRDGRTRTGGDSCTKPERPELETGAESWCKRDGRTRARGDSCTKTERPELETGAGTWCKGDRRTRAGGDSCTKSDAWRWRIASRLGASS